MKKVFKSHYEAYNNGKVGDILMVAKNQGGYDKYIITKSELVNGRSKYMEGTFQKKNDTLGTKKALIQPFFNRSVGETDVRLLIKTK